MRQSKPLSESAFQRLVNHLSVEQIRCFPRELLPDPIPLEVIEQLGDRDKREALEELAWSRSAETLSAARTARETLDRNVCDALERAEQCRAAGAEDLDRLVRELARSWRGAAGEGDWLDGSLQSLERVRRLAASMTDEVGTVSRAVDVLERSFVGREAFVERVSKARRHAKAVLERLQASLGGYHVLELDIAHGDMKIRHWQCETSLARQRELAEQIGIVREKLERQNRLSARILRPGVARRQRETLLGRLQTLTQRYDGVETPISEDELLHWLDVLTDASLVVAEGEWQSKAQRTRLLLYRLMNVYCLQQEAAAQQVASNPTIRINAREAIDYYLGSEEFMLRYFSRKRQSVTLWLAGAARDKLASLDRVRDAILSDYRRMARLRTREGGQEGEQAAAAAL